MCAIFGMLWYDSTNEMEAYEYFLITAIFAAQIEDIQRHIRSITIPIEKEFI